MISWDFSDFTNLLKKLFSCDVYFICFRPIYLYYIVVNRFGVYLQRYSSAWICCHVFSAFVHVFRYNKSNSISIIWLDVSGVIKCTTFFLRAHYPTIFLLYQGCRCFSVSFPALHYQIRHLQREFMCSEFQFPFLCSSYQAERFVAIW